MSRIWFSEQLETAVTYWRLSRRDGVTLGFVAHDRDLWFDGVLHRAAPGMLPSAIRRTAAIEPENTEVQGALSHDALNAQDLFAGRFDQAAVEIGLVDWQSLERQTLVRGTLGAITQSDEAFAAEFHSAKAVLARDTTPRTSPGCRARFCGPGCTLSALRFEHRRIISALDPDASAVALTPPIAIELLIGGELRWLDGPRAGQRADILAETGGKLVLSVPIDETLAPGTRVVVREGCDRTLETCSTRFANALNFRGEPFLPGNDQVARYPAPAT